ncbi:MAG: energy transducer TonB [Mucilaginibacter sp.]
MFKYVLALLLNLLVPGGMEAFGKFLGKTIRYPLPALRNRTQGRVRVSFTVERDGTLTAIRATTYVGDGCEEEAVRVMKLSPKWIPGMQNGRPVRVSYSVPVSFSIN